MNAARPFRDVYFHLSHDHGPSTRVDLWISQFYDDLQLEVARIARRGTDLDVGLADFLFTGDDREQDITRALHAARVLVPLYSVDYLEHPLREREIFRQRLVFAGAENADQHIQPVLWSPLTADSDAPDLDAAQALGADFPEYARYGLSAMCRLTSHADHYRVIVRRLAARIVDVAEGSVVPRVAPRLPPELSEPEMSQTPFIIAVVAPVENRLPQHRQPACYGPRAEMWRPFRNSHDMPVATYTQEVARSLKLPARVVDFAIGGTSLATCPGVILVDPWILAHEEGNALLHAAYATLRNWVTLVVVVDRNDAQYARGERLARQALLMGAPSQGNKLARDVAEFESLILGVVARTRRRYLTDHRPPPPDAPPLPEEGL